MARFARGSFHGVCRVRKTFGTSCTSSSVRWYGATGRARLEWMGGHDPTRLAQLEAESIHIIREVAAEFRNTVMLYSIGKDMPPTIRAPSRVFLLIRLRPLRRRRRAEPRR